MAHASGSWTESAYPPSGRQWATEWDPERVSASAEWVPRWERSVARSEQALDRASESKRERASVWASSVRWSERSATPWGPRKEHQWALSSKAGRTALESRS